MEQRCKRLKNYFNIFLVIFCRSCPPRVQRTDGWLRINYFITGILAMVFVTAAMSGAGSFAVGVQTNLFIDNVNCTSS
jgi:hypothetical protein